MMKNMKTRWAALMLVCSLMVTPAGCTSASVPETPAAAVSAKPAAAELIEETPADEADESESAAPDPETPEEESIEEPAEETDDYDAYSENADQSDPLADIDWHRWLHDDAYFDEILATRQLARVVNLQSKPETDSKYCVVDMRVNHDTYDVDWDYGSGYETYVSLADWDKIFDAKLYMDTFPMLALQYHYDEEQLLRHFQTVGIHEGRQGSKNFNVGGLHGLVL